MKKLIVMAMAMMSVFFISCGQKKASDDAVQTDSVAIDSVVTAEVVETPHLMFDGIEMGCSATDFKDAIKSKGWEYESYSKCYNKSMYGYLMSLKMPKDSVIKSIELMCLDADSDEGMLWENASPCYKKWKKELTKIYGDPVSQKESATEEDFGTNSESTWECKYHVDGGSVTLTLTAMPMTIFVKYADGE